MFFSQCMLEHHQELTHTHTHKIKGLSTFHFQFNQVKNGQTANIYASAHGTDPRRVKDLLLYYGGYKGKGNFLQTQYRTPQILHTSNKGNP